MKEMSTSFEQYFYEHDPSFSLIIEIGHEVGYANLLSHTAIVGDVWICNRIEIDDAVNFHNQKSMPFLNPNSYCKVPATKWENFVPIRINWESAVSDQIGVWLEFQNGVKVRLETGKKPGWSNAVCKDGPLAQLLT